MKGVAGVMACLRRGQELFIKTMEGWSRSYFTDAQTQGARELRAGWFQGEKQVPTGLLGLLPRAASSVCSLNSRAVLLNHTS